MEKNQNKSQQKPHQKISSVHNSIMKLRNGIEYILLVPWDNSSSKVRVFMLQGKANKTQQMSSIESVARVKFIIIVESKWNTTKLWKKPQTNEQWLFFFFNLMFE